MATVLRLSKMQRCKYLNPERWISGELCFWRGKPGFNQEAYEQSLTEWLTENKKKIKDDNR